MPYPVDSGLFIGVSGYPNLARHRVLERTDDDARCLSEYFHAASPDGVWPRLVDDTSRRPTRSAIIEQVTKIAKSVRDGHAAIIYFAGHAYARDGQLYLTCSDFQPRFVVDSAVPLARILQVLKSCGSRRRFFVVLDCCRLGSDDALGDDVPQNVCVLYAASQGEEAVESSEGGLLRRSFLSTCHRLVADETYGGRGRMFVTIAADRFIQELRMDYAGQGGMSGPNLDIVGCFPGDLLLKVPADQLNNGRNSELVSIVVAASQATVAEQQRILKAVAFSRYRDALHSSSRKPAGKGFDPPLIRLRRSPEGLAVLEKLLHEHWFAFDSIDVVWETRMPQSAFAALAKGLNCETITSTTNMSGDRHLSWDCSGLLGSARGVLVLSCPPDAGSCVRITCQSAEAEIRPVACLLPHVVDVVRRLCTLPITGS